MVCTSCKMSYIVTPMLLFEGLVNCVYQGSGGGGVMKKRETLHILDLQRLASLSLVRDYCIM